MPRFSNHGLASAALANWPMAFLAVVWFGLPIGGGEHPCHRVGQPSWWKLSGWTIVAELFILVSALLI